MPVEIKINGDDYKQTVSELVGLAGCFGGTMPVGGEAADAAPATESQKPGRKPRGGKTEPAADPQRANISTGEERIDPNAGKDVETEKPKTEEPKKLTLDDVRKAAQAYVDKWTMAVAGVDLGIALNDAIGKSKISELEGADQETLAKAVKAFTDAYGDGSARYTPKAK